MILIAHHKLTYLLPPYLFNQNENFADISFRKLINGQYYCADIGKQFERKFRYFGDHSVKKRWLNISNYVYYSPSLSMGCFNTSRTKYRLYITRRLNCSNNQLSFSN